jgi:1,4-alpha-glucan branching enzyme
MKSPGELAIVLHTHMPYVEGFGTWPFGEEWLWEAIATSYLPLLDVLESAHPAPITLSLTPVLCDQLEAPGALDRCLRFLREVRPASHSLDIAAQAQAGAGEQVVVELERSQAEYAAAADRLEPLQRQDGGLLGALGAHATWTSSATHALLPLLATDAGIALQLQTGIASHRRRFEQWDGGFWLPECGYGPWLDGTLAEAGVRATCVELTSAFGGGDERHLRPFATDEGPLLWPIDRQTVVVGGGRAGSPPHGAYRDHHALTRYHHRAWSNDSAPYEFERALAQAGADARDFVAAVRRRTRDGGICVCAIDTELLGHWWYEGVHWLAAVIDESERQGLQLTTLDDAAQRHAPGPLSAELAVSSWGEGGDLRTWTGPAVADLAWQVRTAELDVFARGSRPSDRALRELLALQSSDWAFLETRRLAGDYPRERAAGHAARLREALAAGPDPDPDQAPDRTQALRNLAPILSGWEG